MFFQRESDGDKLFISQNLYNLALLEDVSAGERILGLEKKFVTFEDIFPVTCDFLWEAYGELHASLLSFVGIHHSLLFLETTLTLSSLQLSFLCMVCMIIYTDWGFWCSVPQIH